MTVNIADNHFSSRSSASRTLSTALRELNIGSVSRRTTVHFERYLMGLEHLVIVDSPTRDFALRAWHEDCLRRAVERIKPVYEKYGLPFLEYENILMHRLREALLSGRIMQKMRM